MSELKKETFSQRLQRLREEKGVSQKKMAELIGEAPSTYHDWESGTKKLPPFQKISQVLAVSVTELIAGELPNTQEILDAVKELEEKVVELKNKISSKL